MTSLACLQRPAKYLRSTRRHNSYGCIRTAALRPSHQSQPLLRLQLQHAPCPSAPPPPPTRTSAALHLARGPGLRNNQRTCAGKTTNKRGAGREAVVVARAAPRRRAGPPRGGPRPRGRRQGRIRGAGRPARRRGRLRARCRRLAGPARGLDHGRAAGPLRGQLHAVGRNYRRGR